MGAVCRLDWLIVGIPRNQRRLGGQRMGWLNFFVLGTLFLIVLVATTSAALAPTFTTIDVPGVALTQARGINNRGQIVGSGGPQEFLLDDGVFTTIEFPGAAFTDARSINDRGQIVGYYEADGIFHGLLWHQQ